MLPRGHASSTRHGSAALLVLGLAWGPGRPSLFVGKSRAGAPVAPARRRGAAPRTAAPWDGVASWFGDQEPVKLPSTTELLRESLQDCILTVVEKAYPRADFELPSGFRLGIEAPAGNLTLPPGNVEPKAVARGDREFASTFAMLFSGLQLNKAITVCFRDEKLAAAAKRFWKSMTGVKVAALPNTKRASFGPSRLSKSLADRPYLVAVSPNDEQLAEILELDKIRAERGQRLNIILVNARLRLRDGPDELKDQLAVESNPAYYMRFAGKGGQAALIYRSLGTPWVVARRKTPRGELEELSRFEDEPSPREVEEVLAK